MGTTTNIKLKFKNKTKKHKTKKQNTMNNNNQQNNNNEKHIIRFKYKTHHIKKQIQTQAKSKNYKKL